MPEQTLLDFADHGALVAELSADAALARFAADGVDVRARPNTLQTEAEQGFTASWQRLMACSDARTQALT
jgi:hypothetical protein